MAVLLKFAFLGEGREQRLSGTLDRNAILIVPLAKHTGGHQQVGVVEQIYLNAQDRSAIADALAMALESGQFAGGARHFFVPCLSQGDGPARNPLSAVPAVSRRTVEAGVSRSARAQAIADFVSRSPITSNLLSRSTPPAASNHALSKAAISSSRCVARQTCRQ